MRRGGVCTQAFAGAERVVCGLGFPANVTVQELSDARVVQDDRVHMHVTDSAVFWGEQPQGGPF